MAILTEGARKAAFIVSEANDWRSRDTGTVSVPSGGYEAGTILGRLTSDGKYVRLNSGSSTGAENAAGILFSNETENGDAECVIIARDAEVNASELVYEDGATDAQITAANEALASLGIIVR